jgi:hypothetical protein
LEFTLAFEVEALEVPQTLCLALRLGWYDFDSTWSSGRFHNWFQATTLTKLDTVVVESFMGLAHLLNKLYGV